MRQKTYRVKAMKIPGFIDLQVNGYKGVNFSDPKLKLDDILFVNRKLLKSGTIGYCPTLISSPLKTYKRNLPLIVKASQVDNGAKILGIHLEGPFIDPSDGPRGIHLQENIIPPSIQLFKDLYSWAQKKIALITLDPEQGKAFELIRYISENSNTVVSLGHTLAQKDIINKAITLGARAATHIGNGISEQIHRHDNPIWHFLADERIIGLFITDGFHLPLDFIRVGLRAKGISNFIITSDLVHLAGLEPGDYSFNDTTVRLEESGYLHRRDSSLLAGSTSPMLKCMDVLASLKELTLKELVTIGYSNPLRLLNKSKFELPEEIPEISYEGGTFKNKRIDNYN